MVRVPTTTSRAAARSNTWPAISKISHVNSASSISLRSVPREMRANHRVCGLALAALALLFSGCATFRSYDKELRGALSEVGSGNVDAAIGTLESNNRSEKKDLLYYFELGELQRLKDRYPDSQRSWMSANERVHSWEAAAK